MEQALDQGVWPVDMMASGIVNREVDEDSEDEGAPFGETFEEEDESGDEAGGRAYHAATGNKRAKVAGAFGAASSSGSQGAPAAGTQAYDEANKSPDGWNWLKTHKGAQDAFYANSMVVVWKSGEEGPDCDETGSKKEPLG
jgi:hypothetical protein